MTELDKLNARIQSLDEALAAINHAAVVDRKNGHDKHYNGHFTKALAEITAVKAHVESLKTRIQ